LSLSIQKCLNNSITFKDFESAEIYVKNNLSLMGDKDIIVTMGAGEASKIGDFLMN